jgi:TonB family protein
MARRLALAVEIDCDARVIRATHEPYAYGLTLLSVAERHTVALPLATRLFESRLNIEARLDAMTTPVRRYPMATSLPYAAIALIVLATTAWAPRPDSLRARTRGEAASPSPRPLPGNPAPRYPERLRIDGIEGGVIVEFSVNARGIPDTSTVRTVESTHEFFAAAVRTVVPLWRFDSAGVVRVPVRFLTARTEEKERAGQRPPKFANDPGPLETIVVVTIR